MSITEMILRIIENNINGRKLVMRFKDSALEKRIMEQLGIAVSFYISNVKSRVNNVDVFEDEIIKNQSDKYYFLITKELKWNKADSAKYTEWGYEEDKDTFGSTLNR